LTWVFAVLGSFGLLMALTGEHAGAQHISHVVVMEQVDCLAMTPRHQHAAESVHRQRVGIPTTVDGVSYVPLLSPRA
jgi:hypothetical protein